jgi:regulator of sigma E protease
MLTTLVAGAFVLGVVVLVHEFGHFIVAKWAGVYVKTFSIGFGKKLLKFRKGETVYAISVLPFGGYVKFAGESEYYGEGEAPAPPPIEERKPDDEVPDNEIPRERYFTTRPVGARAAVLFAGPFMNYLLAVALYIGVSYVDGTQVYDTTTIGTVVAGSPADSVGLAPGDRIVSIDGVPAQNWGDVIVAVADDVAAVKHFEIERGDKRMDIDFKARMEGDQAVIGFQALVTPKVGRVKRGKPAYNAGIREGAVIESINDTTLATFEDLQRIIEANPDVTLFMRWRQGGQAHADSITPEAVKALKPGSMSEFTTVGRIGLEPYYVKRRESLPESFVRGFTAANDMIVRIVSYLAMLVTGKMGVETLGGPILITQMAGDVARWGFDYLLVFLAFFSVNLCIFNLIPLLPFDGGHLALLLYEGIARRPINRRLRDIFAQAGFVLIILLMVFVIVLDVNRCSGSGASPF